MTLVDAMFVALNTPNRFLFIPVRILLQIQHVDGFFDHRGGARFADSALFQTTRREAALRHELIGVEDVDGEPFGQHVLKLFLKGGVGNGLALRRWLDRWLGFAAESLGF